MSNIIVQSHHTQTGLKKLAPAATERATVGPAAKVKAKGAVKARLPRRALMLLLVLLADKVQARVKEAVVGAGVRAKVMLLEFKGGRRDGWKRDLFSLISI